MTEPTIGVDVTDDSLRGRWALVLGVSAGMGRATALELARAGMNIAGVHFDTATKAAEVQEIHGQIDDLGVQVEFFNENAANERARRHIVEELRDRLAGEQLKVVLHSLAFGSLTSYLPADGLQPATKQQLEMTMNVMSHSLVYWVQSLLDHALLGEGSKVFAMTSAGTARYTATYGLVSAAKAALESHVRQLSVECAPRGIAVNAIRAGVTLTESFLRIPESAELAERARIGNPHGRLTAPDDVATAIALLSRAPGSWITGNIIGVDGGEILTV